jgi:ribonucleoside-triphosphate reductase
MVTLNLPRIGYLTKDEDEALELIKNQMRIVNRCFLATMENIVSKTFSELKFISKWIGEDRFCHFDDGLCTVGVTGMKEFVELLAGNYAKNKKLALKVIKTISRELEKNESIRSGVVELDFTPVTQSFLNSDSAKFRNAMKRYTGGVDLPLSDEEKIDFMGDLHEALKGGHMCQLKNLNMEKLDKVLKSNVGMVAGKGLDVF